MSNLWFLIAGIVTAQLILQTVYLSRISRHIERVANELNRLNAKDATTQ